MSSNNKAAGTNSRTTDTTSEADPQVSFNQTVRDAGFRNFHEFLLSYNLRISEHDDVEEGKAILRGLFPERKNI
ncbi:hypothetical protein E6O75_ATG10485 [Venturia nashicola]|uniref:Uncharacterized protein n=1 Tax=Venturia nashicola TaxID=86259 RepID=A0A4Z1NPX2_9PEZI|nr:hypothetical protein E6O75_ATG10485 [Venturia nashicola]